MHAHVTHTHKHYGRALTAARLTPHTNTYTQTLWQGADAARLTPHSCNLHNRCLRIAPELVLVGFGGRASEWVKKDKK
jgi:hypothetical protein